MLRDTPTAFCYDERSPPTRPTPAYSTPRRHAALRIAPAPGHRTRDATDSVTYNAKPITDFASHVNSFSTRLIGLFPIDISRRLRFSQMISFRHYLISTPRHSYAPMPMARREF
jgi:hypothetical protein